MTETVLHEIIQSYFDKLYNPLINDVRQSMFSTSNEIYGELYYYSVVKLLKYLIITEQDHFLDIGSGLGKLVFQIFLTTHAGSVTGIEINQKRHRIASQVSETIKQQLPKFFSHKRGLTLLEGDFLNQDFPNITIVYICATVFSFELLQAIGEKINDMFRLQTIISLRKIPNLEKFTLSRKIFLQGTWDNSVCYIYTRKKQNG